MLELAAGSKLLAERRAVREGLIEQEADRAWANIIAIAAAGGYSSGCNGPGGPAAAPAEGGERVLAAVDEMGRGTVPRSVMML